MLYRNLRHYIMFGFPIFKKNYHASLNQIANFSMSTMNVNSSTSSLNSVSGSRIGKQIRSFQAKPATTHRLVSAWNGLRELVGYSYRGGLNPVTSGLPLHTAWSQYDLSLAVGGDAR